jgi:hypothetical protein
LLSSKTVSSFEILKKATDYSRNYADYRAQVKRTTLPCLPFLGLYLTDLTFTDDGNPDTRYGRLINFDKYAKTARIISDLIHYQAPYEFVESIEIQEFLFQSIEERGDKDPQQLYEHSLILEPKDIAFDSNRNGERTPTPGTPAEMYRELEAKIDMLEKAGML